MIIILLVLFVRLHSSAYTCTTHIAVSGVSADDDYDNDDDITDQA